MTTGESLAAGATKQAVGAEAYGAEVEVEENFAANLKVAGSGAVMAAGKVLGIQNFSAIPVAAEGRDDGSTSKQGSQALGSGQLMLIQHAGHGSIPADIKEAELEDEDIIDFDLKEIEGKVWLPRGQVDRKLLHNNLFLLDFERKKDLDFVLEGGPWRHKGDALIVVPYDGKMRPSDLEMNAIAMWLGKFVEIHKEEEGKI
ncbi:hypothetical protein ACP4OV_028879 [Aristida adscensionis]